MERLGKNADGYRGETIDIGSILNEIEGFARDAGWRFEPVPTELGFDLQTWHRPAEHCTRRVYLSAGIHGDEPAGPLAIRQLIAEDAWPEDTALWLCPCLNPAGFALNRRGNAAGTDLNRQYLHLEAPETRAHVDWLQRQPNFDITLCLHEDWESLGFYLYEVKLDDRPSRADEIIRRVSRICPIDRSAEIEGRPATEGIIRPSADPRSRAQWPEAFWLLQHKTRHAYTVEAPSDFPMATRVDALVTSVRAVLET